MSRRSIFARIFTILAVPFAAAAAAPPRGRTITITLLPDDAPLPAFPTPDMGLSVEETLSRLIAWGGGPAQAVMNQISWLEGALGVHWGQEWGTDEAQGNHVSALLDQLRRHGWAHWDGPDDLGGRITEACRAYGYGRGPRPPLPWLDRLEAGIDD